MLVLVNVRIVWLAQSIARPIAGLSLLILMIAGTPPSALAQAGGSNTTSNSVSVLETPDSGNPAISSPAANATAAIQSSPGTLSVREPELKPAFPQPPSPPPALLVPQSPARDSFTKPSIDRPEFDRPEFDSPQVSSEGFANELRDDEEEDNFDNNVVTA